jgi:hypothetical protein
VCTFKKAIENFVVKVDVQKASLRFREKIGNGSSCHYLFDVIVQLHPMDVINSMTFSGESEIGLCM